MLSLQNSYEIFMQQSIKETLKFLMKFKKYFLLIYMCLNISSFKKKKPKNFLRIFKKLHPFKLFCLLPLTPNIALQCLILWKKKIHRKLVCFASYILQPIHLPQNSYYLLAFHMGYNEV